MHALLLRTRGSSHDSQFVAVPEHVAQPSQAVQTPLLLNVPAGQAAMHALLLRTRGSLHDSQFVAVPEHVAQSTQS